MLALVSVLPFCPAVAGAFASDEDRPYRYLSYRGTMAYFENLRREYPDFVETWIAQEAFPEILPSKKSWAECEGEHCRTLIVRIANKRRLEDQAEALKRPEVFFSGALHGDERVGPLVVTELAGFLCRQYRKGDVEIQRLVDERNTWIMPMTNAFGYAHNVRHENNMDPNRDFPYLQSPRMCMQTQTGRAVNELFRRHLFQFTLTFHGGMRALTYEWGSHDHMRNGRSTESPDDVAFTEVGMAIRAASGKDGASHSWYPFGRINDLVYPVNGGLEDWSYAAGFARSPSPITVCRPSTYGGYDDTRTKYQPGSVASLVFLAEMDDAKTPSPSTLGSSAQVWGLGRRQGHVARNLRMCLKLIELAKPEVVVHPLSWPSRVPANAELAVDLHGFGCLTLSSAQLLLIQRERLKNCSTLRMATEGAGARAEVLTSAVRVAALPKAVPCRGLSVWEPPPPGSAAVELRGGLPPGLSGDFCVAVAAEFDQSWGQQSRPDPALRPRAHAARLRLEEHYVMTASDGLQGTGEPMRLDEHRTKLFPVLPTALTLLPVSASASPAPRLGPSAPAPPLLAAATPSLGPPGGQVTAGASFLQSPIQQALTAFVLVVLGVTTCHLMGAWRLASGGCRSLPSVLQRTVIGRQAPPGPEEAEVEAPAE